MLSRISWSPRALERVAPFPQPPNLGVSCGQREHSNEYTERAQIHPGAEPEERFYPDLCPDPPLRQDHPDAMLSGKP